MRVVVTVQGDLADWAKRNNAKWARAATAGVAETAKVVQAAWRAEISPVLGRKLANSIRYQVYPKGQPSPNAAALIWSKAPEIIGAHDKGVTIRSENGFYLAIPTEAAGRGARGVRLTPGEWEARRGVRLRFVYRPNGPSLLVADDARLNKRGIGVASRSKTGRGFTTVPIFILVPQVRLRKRLNLAAASRDGASGLPARIRAAAQKGL